MVGSRHPMRNCVKGQKRLDSLARLRSIAPESAWFCVPLGHCWGFGSVILFSDRMTQIYPKGRVASHFRSAFTQPAIPLRGTSNPTEVVSLSVPYLATVHTTSLCPLKKCTQSVLCISVFSSNTGFLMSLYLDFFFHCDSTLQLQ